nr:zinc-binding dehydrogenase [Knoellia subterranea]
MGANRVIDYRSEDFTRLDDRFDVVIDAVGKSTFGRCRRLLAPGGVYISSELGPGWQNLPLAAVGLATRGRRRVVFPYPEEGQHVVEAIRDLLASGAFRPVIDRSYPLDDIVEAHRYVESGVKIGNVVVRLDRD